MMDSNFNYFWHLYFIQRLNKNDHELMQKSIERMDSCDWVVIVFFLVICIHLLIITYITLKG